MFTKLKQPRSYRALPRRRLRIRSLLWIVIGFSLITVIGSVWFLILTNTQISSQSTFIGEVRPATDPISLYLPRGSVLKSVEVELGDHIKRGQTIAMLDVDAMGHAYSELQAQLLHDALLRDCILNENSGSAVEVSDLSKRMQTLAQIADEECKAFHNQKLRTIDKNQKEKTLKQEERQLVQRFIEKWSPSLQTKLNSEERGKRLDQALVLAFLRSVLDQEIASITRNLEEKQAKWQTEKLLRIKALDEKIQANSYHRRQLKALIEHPRLHAPATGRIIQARRLRPETPAANDIELIAIRAEASNGYHAIFKVPVAQLAQVTVGQHVNVKMLGHQQGAYPLSGAITALESENDASVRAIIQLDAESVAQLDSLRSGIALKGMRIASAIRVKNANIETKDVFREALKSAVPTQGTAWFLQRFLPSRDVRMQDKTRRSNTIRASSSYVMLTNGGPRGGLRLCR